MSSEADTPGARGLGEESTVVPSSKVTAAEIGRAWGTSRAYASACIKKGCPTDSIEAASEWRKAKSVYGVGYRSKKSRVESGEGATTVEKTAPRVARGDEKAKEVATEIPACDAEGELLPDVPDLRALHSSLVGAINMELAAYRNARRLLFAEAAIRAYNNARDGRFAAEKAYREEMERRRILVPLEEAMRLSRKGYDVLRPALLAMGARVGANCNPDNPGLAAGEIDREVAAVLRQAENAYAARGEGEQKGTGA